MQKPRPVPGIGHLQQQFSRASLPPIQSPMQSPQVPIHEQGDDPQDDLAQEIFARLAVNHLMHNPIAPDSRILREMAQNAQIAAAAYFDVAD